jgi:hypothetical protein
MYGGTALHSPPDGTQGGGLRHPSPRPIKRREAPHLRLFKRAVNARAVNTESFGDLVAPHALRLHLAHLRRVYRGWPAFVDARGLSLRDTLKLPLATQVRSPSRRCCGRGGQSASREHVALAQDVEHCVQFLPAGCRGARPLFQRG